MFGFFRWKKAANRALEYIEPMFSSAKLHGPIPPTAIGDAYVVGFLQILTMHAVQEKFGESLPQHQLPSLFEYVMNRLVPGLGKNITSELMAVNDPRHPAHINYSVGRREAGEYINALKINDTTKACNLHKQFNDFIKRVYMDIPT